MSESTPQPKRFSLRIALRDRPALIALALLILGGLALRVWGIGWSLPDGRHPAATYHPDELVNLNAANAVDLLGGKLDIGFYNYGTLYFYLVHIAHLFGRGYGAIPTPAAPPPDMALNLAEQLARMAPTTAGLFLWGRYVTALLGAATIPILYALGTRLFGQRVGLLAAALYAVAPLAVVHAHFLTVDVPATFFSTLALLWAARLLQNPPRWQEALLAGVWVGCAAATKYNVGLVFLAPLLALLANQTPEASKTRGAALAALCGGTLVAFLVACPGPLLNWEAFWNGLPNYPGSGVRYELFVHSREGHGEVFAQTGFGWWVHLRMSLLYGLDIPLFALSLAGIVFACLRRTRADAVLLGFTALYFLLAGFSAVRFARYMIPLIPVCCLFAARFVCDPPQLRWRKGFLALGGLTAVYTLFVSLAYVHAMTQPDPRDRAADYLEKNAPAGASVAFAKVPWFFSPPLSPRFGLLAAPMRSQAAQETTRFQLRLPANEWDVSVLQPPPDYAILSNFETMHALERLRLPPAVQFRAAIPANYQRVVFTPSASFGLAASGRLIPEDLLYILPEITLYERPR